MLPGSPRQPLRTFTPPGKLVLALEIVVAYARARRWLRRPDITETVALARSGASAGGAPGRPQTAAPSPREEASPGEETLMDEEALLGLRLGEVIQRVFRLLPGDTRCLTRSLVLVHILARRRVQTTLIIGVRAAPSFGAHAWVEHQGRPLLEPIEPDGQRLVEL